MEKLDIAIIGAGPAGISCGLKLLKEGKSNFMIYEKGRTYNKRYCHVDYGKLCTKCNGICNVISGFGGCIHYGDSVKLSVYPSGKRLYGFMGKLAYGSCLEFVLKDFIQESLNNFEVTSGKEITEMDVKDYGISLLNSKHVNRILEHSFSCLNSNRHISLETKVTKIYKEKSGFTLILEKEKEEKIIYASKVVIATGRDGLNWWKRLITCLGVEAELPVISLGFRFEMEKKYLADIGKKHPDLKLRFVKEEKKFKTFCFCAGINGGRLKCESYGDFITLDGHILTDEDRISDLANFALLMQLTTEGEPVTYQQLLKKYIGRYKKLSDCGSPIFQNFFSFKNREYSQEDNSTSLTNAISAPLWRVLDSGEHKLFCEVADEIFKWIMTFNKMDLKEYEEFVKSINVLGIEIESLWDTVSLDSSMMTNIDGLYVIGDSAGVAQGIIPAAISGVYVADLI